MPCRPRDGLILLRRGTGRVLTQGERGLVAAMFGIAIDHERVRIHDRRWMPFQPAGTIMAPDGHLWFPPGNPIACVDFSAAPLGWQGMFLHEMTHVWQHQRGILLPLRRHPFCRYGYSLVPGWTLSRYGLEQQAEIVRHVFLLRHGIRVVGAPPLERYDGVLPFAPPAAVQAARDTAPDKGTERASNG